MRPLHIVLLASTSFVVGRAADWRVPVSPNAQHVLGGAAVPLSNSPAPWAGSGGGGGGGGHNDDDDDDDDEAPQPRAGFVALGDSYSAGIGTGFEGKENACRQGLGAYPRLIAADLATRHPGPNATAFQFLSCTGSTTEDLLSHRAGGGKGADADGASSSQIDAIDRALPVDFALLSVGGNDLGFFAVMNACVFRFYNFYSGTCEAALAAAEAELAGDAFDARLHLVVHELLDALRWERLPPSFRVFVTGYARFFDATTAACDDASLGVWFGGPRPPRLTRPLRRRVNALVRAVNTKIARVVARVNAGFARHPRLVWVDYDAAFDGHRFCEPGVAEPDYDRADTWFFLVGGPDNARNATADDDDVLAPGSPLVDPAACLGPAERSGDWGALALCYMARSLAEDPTLRPAAHLSDGPAAAAAGRLRALNGMWYVPTYYGKTFHPRSRAHEAIRDSIYDAWARQET